MVAFCFDFDELASSFTWSLAEVSAGVADATSSASPAAAAAAAAGSEDEADASGVAVRPKVRGGRPCTAEALLSRAITWGVWVRSTVDCEASVGDARPSKTGPCGEGAEM